MALADSYSDGILAVGQVRYSTDEKTIHHPHHTHSDEALALLRKGSDRRRHLAGHLCAIVEWLADALLGPWEYGYEGSSRPI